MSDHRRPILVTGAAGFIGARFVESCRARGREVISVDAPAHFEERPEHRGIDFGAVVDREALFGWLEREQPDLDAIVHLGACTDTTNLDLAYQTRVNTDYSRAVWNFARHHGVPLVYASSAATYGDGALGYDDNEALILDLEPLNPYGLSKQRFDIWALEEEELGRTPPAWCGFKFFNVYGFGERHKGRMASMVLQAHDQIVERGRVRLFRSHRDGVPDGQQARDFVWVGDVVEVLHFALERPIPRGIYNLGTGEARTFRDLTRAVFRSLGRDEDIEFIDTPESIRSRYQYFTQATTNRLVIDQGYLRPFAELEDGVARTVERLQRLDEEPLEEASS